MTGRPWTRRGSAQEVERGAEAVEKTAVAAEEGEVAVAAEGVGGAAAWEAWRGQGWNVD